MSSPYSWDSFDKFEAKSTDVLIGIAGPADALEVFLRSVGISDSHTWSKSGTSRSVKPRRLQGHPNVGDRIVLVELPPSDNSIGGLAELEVWLDENYCENLHTRMRITRLLWLINTRDVPKPTLLFTSTAFESLKPFFENGGMVHSTFPITLQFCPSISPGESAQRSNHEKFVKEKLKAKGDFSISAWTAEGDGTPTRQLDGAIRNRDQRVMRKLSGTSDHKPSDIIVAVMGATGTGKTNFIVKAREVLCPDSPASEGPASGESLKGGTKDISAYRILNHPDYGNKVVLLDTPGFDDSIQDDGRILEKIGDWIKHTYRDHCGVTLTGILYFNRMSDNRANGTALRNLKLLGNLCGTHAAANVVFVTTMWDTMMKTPEGENKAKERLEEYKKKWWRRLLDLGAQHAAFLNDFKSLESILRGMTNRDGKKRITVLLDELVRLEKDVRETGAARAIQEDQEKAIRKLREEYEELMNEIPNLKDGTEEKKMMKEQASGKDKEWQQVAQGRAEFTPPPRGIIRAVRQGVLQLRPGAPRHVRLGE